MLNKEYLPLEGKVAQQIYLKSFKSNEFVETDEVFVQIFEAHIATMKRICRSAATSKDLTAHLLSLAEDCAEFKYIR